VKALVAGAGGQLGRALAALAPSAWTVAALDRTRLDITDASGTLETVEAARPDLIINAAAYTAVDRAEAEPDLAFRVNADGPANLARAAARIGARLIHVSTDFVFDGRSGVPWRPSDATAPLGVYGASKLAGERAILALDAGSLIVRSAWVYSRHGANFLTTMLRLMNDRAEIRVVADQIGTPTSAASLATALWRLAETDARGVLHYTDAGVASWYDFAQAIAEEAAPRGLVPAGARVTPIAAADYPTAARRPAFSVLETSEARRLLGVPVEHWRERLREVLEAMRDRP